MNGHNRCQAAGKKLMKIARYESEINVAYFQRFLLQYCALASARTALVDRLTDTLKEILGALPRNLIQKIKLSPQY